MGTAVDDAFSAFVRVHSSRLVAHALYLGAPSAQAQDLVQDVLVRCYPRWGRISRDDPYPYVARAVTNAVVDGARRRRRRPETPTAEVPDRPSAPPDVAIASLDEALSLLALLAPRERQVVVLRYFADLTEAQVADQLGIAVGTVKSTHASALSRLRQSGHPSLDRSRS